MTAEDTYATRLAKKITASERAYLRLADDCRKAYDAIGDVRWRAMAEGLAMARDHMLSVAREMSPSTGEPRADAFLNGYRDGLTDGAA
jgi:hypothetical protein